LNPSTHSPGTPTPDVLSPAPVEAAPVPPAAGWSAALSRWWQDTVLRGGERAAGKGGHRFFPGNDSPPGGTRKPTDA
jgi:hypothetical protein